MSNTAIHDYFSDIDADLSFEYGLSHSAYFDNGEQQLTLYFDPVSNVTTAVVMRPFGNLTRPYTCSWDGVFSESDPLNLTLCVFSLSLSLSLPSLCMCV